MNKLEVQAAATDRDERYSQTCFYLFAAGILAGLLQLSRPVPWGAGYEMLAIAKNLAAHGSFANPFWVLKTGPTAANPPLYPFILAVYIKVFRLSSLIMLMATVGNIVMNALTASLLPRLSRLFFGSVVPGIVASIFWMGSALLMPTWDVAYTTALLLVFLLYTGAKPHPSQRPLTLAFFGGAMSGALFLLNPSTVLIVGPWLVYLLMRHKIRLKGAVLLFLTLTLIVFLWMIRNKLELGAFRARTNLGMTLYASNNDCSQSSMYADELRGCYQAHHPNTSLSEARLLLSMGEPKYDHMRILDTEHWIKTHPGRFTTLTLERFKEFWFPPLRWNTFSSLMIGLATFLSIPGLILMMYRREPLNWFILFVLFIYPLMYYTVVSDVRYRYPVLWLSLLPAGNLLHHLFIRWRSRQVDQAVEF